MVAVTKKLRVFAGMLALTLCLCVIPDMPVLANGCSGGCNCPPNTTCATTACEPGCGGHDYVTETRSLDCGDSCPSLGGCYEVGGWCTNSTCGQWHTDDVVHNHHDWSSYSSGEDTCMGVEEHWESCDHCGTTGSERTVDNIRHSESPYGYDNMSNYTYYVESVNTLTHSENVENVSNGIQHWRCVHWGEFGESHPYHDQWLNVIYYREQNKDGSFPGWTTYYSSYDVAGKYISISKSEDAALDGLRAISYGYYSEAKPRITYVTRMRKGYNVKFSANGGTGTLADQYMLRNLEYNVKDGSNCFTYNDGTRDYRNIGWTLFRNTSAYKTTQSAVDAVKAGGARETVSQEDAKAYATTGPIGIKFDQKVKNLAWFGDIIYMYAVWKPLWKLNIDYTIVSLDLAGETGQNPDNHTAPINGKLSKNLWTFYDYYDELSGLQSKIGDNGSLPTLSLRGWTFKGWEIYPTGTKLTNRATADDDSYKVYDTTPWTWDCDMTAYPRFMENRYNVTYHDVQPDTTTVLDNTYVAEKVHYETTTYVLPENVVGFAHAGYYIDGYTYDIKYRAAYWKLKLPEWIDPDRNYTDTYRRLNDQDGGNYDIYAVWKPVPVQLRIWDNYHMWTKTRESEPYEALRRDPWDLTQVNRIAEHNYYTMTVYCNRTATLPSQAMLASAFGSHPDAKLVGFVTKPTHDLNNRLDYVKVDYVPSGDYNVDPNVAKLGEKQPVVDIYCVWDDAPTITCKELPKFNRDVAIAAGYDVSDNTISITELENWCLKTANVTVHDNEWTQRYGTEKVPLGINNGYSVRVASIDPKSMHDNIAQSKDTVDYVVTFIVTDDAGNQATATADLYFGTEMSILIDTQ